MVTYIFEVSLFITSFINVYVCLSFFVYLCISLFVSSSCSSAYMCVSKNKHTEFRKKNCCLSMYRYGDELWCFSFLIIMRVKIRSGRKQLPQWFTRWYMSVPNLVKFSTVLKEKIQRFKWWINKIKGIYC